MVNNFHTLKALVTEWTPDLVGCEVADAFSQQRGEWTLALATPETEWMLRVSTQRPMLFIFRTEGYSKARRNVATLFEQAFDRRVVAVRVAERDRMLFLDLDDGACFQIVLFGARANVFWVDADGMIGEAFQESGRYEGEPPPEPRAAPTVATFADFEARWRTNRKTTEQAVASAFPLFDRTLAAEVLYRAAVPNQPPANCTAAQRHTLFETAIALQTELRNPSPRIYWQGRFADTLALTRLQHLADLEEETFETVDQAAQVFVRRTLGQMRFRAAYDPLEKALAKAHEDATRRTERMLEELSKESRADKYEHWGHLLMASVAAVPLRADEVTLPDLFADNAPITIPLESQRTAVENAERYYDKARRTRQAREHAEERVLAAEQQAEQAKALLDELHAIDRYKDLEAFKKAKANALAPFISEQAGGQARLPFRRFSLGSGYEVWVGKNAKQNDALTFHHAQKYDLWMHARGISGSHTVLRLPNRQAQPDRRILSRAAAIAAYYSKAQGSALVPVMVTPRKYVRKPKGAPPGAVVVEREEVLMVAPSLPK
ncbi:MAG TPA: NFACT RNA binding domain-containing protein [Rhodothermales bacterium]|nr:NFACT RNA binding domain-containing protein [Rhodothermales bacterium]